MGKFIKTFYLTIAVLSSTVAAQPEWCMAKAEPGKPDFQWCSPKDEMAVEYKIEVTGVAGSGYDTNCDIFLGLNGDTGSSSEVQIASAERGTKQHVSIFDNDLVGMKPKTLKNSLFNRVHWIRLKYLVKLRKTGNGLTVVISMMFFSFSFSARKLPFIKIIATGRLIALAYSIVS
eukprot:GHVR01083441.1.p1 GENE.GHVR01083441.1~~GHVR01083441.1.p1  ORF type:complete len:175 (+),score=6.06 GHVR01083441.1:81-605(+)